MVSDMAYDLTIPSKDKSYVGRKSASGGSQVELTKPDERFRGRRYAN